MRCSPPHNNAPLQRAVATRFEEALVHREKEREWEEKRQREGEP